MWVSLFWMVILSVTLVNCRFNLFWNYFLDCFNWITDSAHDYDYGGRGHYGGRFDRNRYERDSDYFEPDPQYRYEGRGPRARAVGKKRDLIESAVGLISTKVKGMVKMIRCVLQCFIKYFISNYCNRMFPCLYDCSIGQTYIAPEIEAQLKQAKITYPKGIELGDVFKVFKCLYDCAFERPIKNWETFAATLYCVADTCICFQILGQPNWFK